MSEFIVVLKEYKVSYDDAFQAVSAGQDMEPNKSDLFAYALNLVDGGTVVPSMTTVRETVW
jgi:hypothetical protein